MRRTFSSWAPHLWTATRKSSVSAARIGFPMQNTGRPNPRVINGIVAVSARGADKMTQTSRGLWLPPLWVTPLPDEPPHGMYLRLAERNGFRRVGLLENLVGIKLRHVRLGRDLDHLAAMLRCEPEHLNGTLIKHQRPGSPIVGGEAVRRKDLTMLRRRACPACLAKSAHHRFWWDLGFVATCPIHEIWLAQSCSCGGPLTWADGSLAKCRTCEDGDVRLLPFETASSEVIALDRWVLS